MVVLMDGVENNVANSRKVEQPSRNYFQIYLNCVAGLEGCPVKLGTDCGTENGVMVAMQCTFQQDAEAHKYGSSLVNQRIEGWWVFCRRNGCFKASRKPLEHERSARVLKLPLKVFCNRAEHCQGFSIHFIIKNPFTL